MWVPYRIRPDGDRFRVTESHWVAVPDGGGCIDWDEETEDTDDVFPTEVEALQQADALNVAWLAAEDVRKQNARKH